MFRKLLAFRMGQREGVYKIFGLSAVVQGVQEI